MNEKTVIHSVAIDPLALLLPASIYARLIEKFHPHVPSTADIAAVLKKATLAEKKDIAARTAAVVACTKAVEEAIAVSR